jgi:broad specificity phosphatase PhoE
MTIVEIIRHGPKNPNSVHKTGIEASLTEEGIKLIQSYASNFINKDIFVYSSPVQRAKDTAQVICNVLGIPTYIVDPKFSSYSVNKDKVINMVAPELSKIWGDNKRDVNKEDESLYAWTKAGWENNFREDKHSIRSIAQRLLKRVLRYLEGEEGYHLVIGHSGDIEPLYALLNLPEDPIVTYDNSDGALLPLEGVKFELDGDNVKCIYKGKYSKVYKHNELKTLL